MDKNERWKRKRKIKKYQNEEKLFLGSMNFASNIIISLHEKNVINRNNVISECFLFIFDLSFVFFYALSIMIRRSFATLFMITDSYILGAQKLPKISLSSLFSLVTMSLLIIYPRIM